MTSFQERGQGYERKYVHSKEMEFKIHSRNMQLLAGWAASQLGKHGKMAEEYIRLMVLADFQAKNEEKCIQRLQTDFTKAGLAVSAEDILRHKEQFYMLAYEQMAGNA